MQKYAKMKQNRSRQFQFLNAKKRRLIEKMNKRGSRNSPTPLPDSHGAVQSPQSEYQRSW